MVLRNNNNQMQDKELTLPELNPTRVFGGVTATSDCVREAYFAGAMEMKDNFRPLLSSKDKKIELMLLCNEVNTQTLVELESQLKEAKSEIEELKEYLRIALLPDHNSHIL
jgi:hypothetical protein